MPHLTFFSRKSTRPPLEYGAHSDVRKIRWPRVTYKALYTSSRYCDSSGTCVAPVVSPRPADCNDVLEKFRNEDRTNLRRVGYWARGNAIKSPCSNISAYLENILATYRMGLNFQEEPTGDAETLGSNTKFPRPRLPQLVTTLVDNIVVTQHCTATLRKFFHWQGPLGGFGRHWARLEQSLS